MEQAHQTIFNKLPISLLMLNLNGTGIKSVERPKIWHHVSTQIEDKFNETGTDSEENKVWELMNKPLKCATLSHTWLQDIYSGWNGQTSCKNSAAFEKLTSFCHVATTDYRLTLGWMDTICINKESSSELLTN